MADNSLGGPQAPFNHDQKPLVMAGEVLDIILDSNHPRYTGVEDIGKIQYKALGGGFTGSKSAAGWCRPLNLSFKQFPLIHEIVVLYRVANKKSGYTENASSYQYLPIANTPHSNINYNPVPGASTANKSNKQENQGSDFTGNQSKEDTAKEDLEWGQYFKDKASDIPRLKPFEGDSIFESRWGTTLRMGSTIKDADIKDGGTKTSWSVEGDSGDPIFIIKNGIADDADPTDLYLENVDDERSAIWMTSTQLINIKLASGRFQTYGINQPRPNGWPSDYQPKLTPSFSGRQVIISSGRIILNAGDDSIFLSSKSSVGIMSEGSIHINSAKPVVIEGEAVHIGLGARQPALLGQSTVDFLRELLIYLQTLDIATAVGPGLCGPGGASNFSGLLGKLEDLKCSVAKVE